MKQAWFPAAFLSFSLFASLTVHAQAVSAFLNLDPNRGGPTCSPLLACDPSDEYPVIIPMNVDGYSIRQQLLSHVKPTDPIYFLTFEFEYSRSTRNFISLIGKTAAARAELERAGQPVAPIEVVIDAHSTTGDDRVTGHPREHEMLQWLANQWPSRTIVKIYNPYDGLTNWHRYAWINHRKILVVGKNLIQGGRNTGSSYLEFLENPTKSFVDVELFFKNNMEPTLIEGASKIVNDMFYDSKWAINLPPNPEHIYRSLRVPGARYLTSIPHDDFIPPPQNAEVPSKEIYMQPVRYAYDWKLLTSEWDNHQDQFRAEIQTAIDQEPSGGEIYLETPYFIPDSTTLSKLHMALNRGVKVRLITNSFLTSDGETKAIPLIMEKDFQKLRAKHGVYAGATITLTQDHMVHAKVYGFAKAGKMFLGSHNLHRRSGLFDKEVMIQFRWDVQAAEKDLSSLNPITSRDEAWQHLQSLYHKKHPNQMLLIPFHSVLKDLVQLIIRKEDIFSFLQQPRITPSIFETFSFAHKIYHEMILALVKDIESLSPKELEATLRDRLDYIDNEFIKDTVGDFL